MREWTIWLAGLLSIASVFLIVALFPIVREELVRAETHPAQNRVLKMALAITLHAGGAIAVVLSPLMGWLGYAVAGVVIFWIVLVDWLLAKLTIINATSRHLQKCLLFMALWTAGWWLFFRWWWS